MSRPPPTADSGDATAIVDPSELVQEHMPACHAVELGNVSTSYAHAEDSTPQQPAAQSDSHLQQFAAKGAEVDTVEPSGGVFHIHAVDGGVTRCKPDTVSFAESVACIQDFTGYTFKDVSYVREALCAERGTTDVGGRLVLQGHQRLAMLGDAALKLAVLDQLMPFIESCGGTSYSCDKLVSNHNLAKVGLMHGVDDMLIMTDGRAIKCERHSLDDLLIFTDRKYFKCEKIAVASAVEAIIGAIWLDSGRDGTILREAVKAILCDDKLD